MSNNRNLVRFWLAVAAMSTLGTAVLCQQGTPEFVGSRLRGPTALSEEGAPPRMLPQSNTDVRAVRNYPEQPPVIPHQIESYQIDSNVNQCMSCHARSRTGESQAPMVSITHFMDRDGQSLANISPRRYFCNQCHVPQYGVMEPVANRFMDVDSLLTQPAGGSGR